jgi:tRNA1Val (adenine37-N6)-methyltransferase
VPNSYFKFKQFTIQQQHSAMKLSTDACLLAALAPISGEVNTICDIGTGTGILSLILAQRLPQALIQAIELDEASAKEARDNIYNSPFAHRIQVVNTDITSYQAHHCFDYIISNPPYFANSLQSPNAQVNKAKHQAQLTFEALIQHSTRLSHRQSQWCFIVPTPNVAQLVLLAQQVRFYPQQIINVQALANKPGKTSIIHFSTLNCTQPAENTFIIYSSPQVMSQAMQALMRPYYLNL